MLSRARSVSLEIIAPPVFFAKHYAAHKNAIAAFGAAIASLAKSELADAPEMPLTLYQFAGNFHHPFANGYDVKDQCGRELKPKGAAVCDAFENLIEVTL